MSDQRVNKKRQICYLAFVINKVLGLSMRDMNNFVQKVAQRDLKPKLIHIWSL